MPPRTILMLYTGGTIGMRQSPRGWTPDADFPASVAALLGSIETPAADRCEVRSSLPLIDSAEAAPEFWYRLAGELWAAQSEYDGFVVLHGTDSLAYTASALSFFLLGFGKPVVLTGAQLPATVPGSDGRANLLGALACAVSPALQEVCVFFDGLLLRGNRTRKWSSDERQCFSSPHWPALARLDRGLQISPDALLQATTAAARALHPPEGNVGLLKVYPGVPAALIEAAAALHPAGLVLEMYGAGTGPARNRDILSTLARLAHAGIPVVGVSQCLKGLLRPELYETSRAFADAGVINGRDLTAEAAVTKLTYLRALGMPPSMIATEMGRSLAGEVTDCRL